MKKSVFFTYFLVTLAVVSWWLLAFHDDKRIVTNDAQSPHDDELPTFVGLSSIQRDHLHKALSGQVDLMLQFIQDWEVDAQLLELAGHPIERLPRHLLLRSQILSRLLAKKGDSYSDLPTEDDLGHLHQLAKKNHCRLFPQTYSSASFLLALAEPTELVALPNGLRNYTRLFPTEMTRFIPLDIDRYNTETLYLTHPDIAFVTSYSDPTLLEALRQQKIPLFHLKPIQNLSEIKDSLLKLGKLIHKPLKAELLTIFMEAAMLAIDNRMQAMRHLFHNSLPKILYLNRFTQYMIPTMKSLTGQLLQRMGMWDALPLCCKNTEAWAVPIDQETLLQMNPDGLIIAAKYSEKGHTSLGPELALNHVNAVKNQCVYFVDQDLQFFPSQYIVLAYYDLFNAFACCLEKYA